MSSFSTLNLTFNMSIFAEAYSESYQIFKMGCFGKIVNGFYKLTGFGKRFVLDVWQCSQFAFAL